MANLPQNLVSTPRNLQKTSDFSAALGKRLSQTSAWCVVSLALGAILVGCGGGAAPAPAPAPNASQTETTTTSTATTPEQNHSTSQENQQQVSAVDPSKKETKWIGKIPYDVFYDQPLEIATDTTALGGASSTSVASVSPASTNSGSMPPPSGTSAPASASSDSAPTASSINWQEVLPMPQLVEVVKLLRTDLTGNLQTVATYNKAQKAIALDGAMLAAMASIVSVHPEETSWKPKAHFVRDLAYEINANSSGNGRGPYMKTKEPFDQIIVILDGGKPPELDSAESTPFAEVVYVADMMQQIEETFNSLKANLNTESRLKEDPAAAEREMRLLWALGSMMTDSSYDSSDEKMYQDFLKRFTDGAREGVQAIQTGNFDGFQAALNQIQTTCAECHQEYRGSDSGF